MGAVGTIVARNYLPFAEVLMESAARHNPELARYVLVTDKDDSTRVEGCHVLGPADVLNDEMELLRQAFMYDVMEFSTALKPLFLKWVLERHPQATFIDPDCQFHSPMPGGRLAAQGSSIALTPHRLTPPPLDGRYPDEQLVKTYGVFNLGFAQVYPESMALLEWWASRLRRHGSIEPAATLYTDQRWMDLAPAYFDVTVVRDPAMNVAPWNIDERALRLDPEPRVDGKPLVFAHFSGVRPLSDSSPVLPRQLLRSDARVGDDEESALAFEELCRDYVEALRCHAYEECRGRDYGWGHYTDGTPISLKARRRYRQQVIRAERAGEPVPAPPPRSLFSSKRLDFLERSRWLEASRSGARADLARVRAAGLREAWRRSIGTVFRRG